MLMDSETRATIAARRQHIRDEARCRGCSATMTSCRGQRGKDPTAPAEFGCCWGPNGPCNHRSDPRMVANLLDEIETGHVRTVEELLLDSIPEVRMTRRGLDYLFKSMMEDAGIYPADRYAREDYR